MKFKHVYIIGNGVMGRLLLRRIDDFYPATTTVYDIDDELKFVKGTHE